MRLFLINIIDGAISAYPLVKLTVYVDDVATEVAATRRLIMSNLPQATRYICERLVQDGAEVSSSKSFCIASSDSLGTDVATQLHQFGFKFRRRVKALGAGLAAGTRRNASVARGSSAACARPGTTLPVQCALVGLPR